MFDGSDKDWCPALPLQRERERRLLTAQFGDGYQQRVLDGINAMNTVWALTFEMKPAAVIEAMDEYLQEQNGHSFPFQDPANGQIYNVFCDSWSIDWNRITFDINGARSALNGTLTAQFRRAYGVAV